MATTADPRSDAPWAPGVARQDDGTTPLGAGPAWAIAAAVMAGLLATSALLDRPVPAPSWRRTLQAPVELAEASVHE